MSGRYELPDPKCQHQPPTGRVGAGSLGGGPHASTYVCARPECIADAEAWAEAFTHLPSYFIPFQRATSAATLFDGGS